jgi:hypothetical protein
VLNAARLRAALRPFAAPIAVALVAFAAYAPVLDVYFLKDDLNLLQLADANGRPSFDAYLRWFGWPKGVYAHDEFYRPLPTLLAFAEFSFFGPVPEAFRFSNLIAHALCAALTVVLVRRLTNGARPYASAFAGLLFALHPSHPEAVVWITQRFVLHQTLWTLLGLLAVDAWIRRGGKAPFVAAVGAALAAALSKETAAVLPAIYGLYGLVAPERKATSRPRLRAVFGAALSATPAALSVVLLRLFLFGTLKGTYGGVSIAEYARTRRTFERLPQSLLDGLRGVNPHLVGDLVRTALGVAFALAAVAALAAIARSFRDRRTRALLVFGLGFAALTLAPMTPIFYCDPWLAGARFLHAPILGIVVAALSGLHGDGRKPRASLAVAAAIAAVFAFALASNLKAYRNADVQIRNLRRGLLEAPFAPKDAAIVLHGAPVEEDGVPTVDLYAPFLCRPPLATSTRAVFPIVEGGEDRFDVDGFRAFLARRGDAPLVHASFRRGSNAVGPVFPDPIPAAGAAPRLFEPKDGAIVACPDRRAMSEAEALRPILDEPTVVFSEIEGAAAYRFVATSTEGATRPGSAPRTFALTLKPGLNATTSNGRATYRFSFGAPEAPPSGLDLWRGLARFGFDPNPLLIMWRVEALDASGRVFGASAENRLVVFLTPARAP